MLRFLILSLYVNHSLSVLNSHALRAFLILFLIATYVFASVLDIEDVVAILLMLYSSVVLFMFFTYCDAIYRVFIFTCLGFNG